MHEVNKEINKRDKRRARRARERKSAVRRAKCSVNDVIINGFHGKAIAALHLNECWKCFDVNSLAFPHAFSRSVRFTTIYCHDQTCFMELTHVWRLIAIRCFLRFSLACGASAWQSSSEIRRQWYWAREKKRNKTPLKHQHYIDVESFRWQIAYDGKVWLSVCGFAVSRFVEIAVL